MVVDTQARLVQGEALLAPLSSAITRPEPNRIDFALEPEQLYMAVDLLINGKWGYLVAITGLDHGPEAGRMEALYHFGSYGAVITLRIQIKRTQPCVPTICSLIPSATFYERELMEMFGVIVEGTPNTDYLYLPEGWPSGVYPLRKDWEPVNPLLVPVQEAKHEQ